MKKYLKLFALAFVLVGAFNLTSCSSNSNSNTIEKESTKSNTVIQLNMDNWKKYILLSEEIVVYSTSTATYWCFSGSPNIIYNDVVIYYQFESTTYTYELTVFGGGQINVSSSRYGSTSYTITNVTGSIELLY